MGGDELHPRVLSRACICSTHPLPSLVIGKATRERNGGGGGWVDYNAKRRRKRVGIDWKP
jgi:hypothetical protein